MKYFFLILLLLLGTCEAEENLTWMIGHTVSFMDGTSNVGGIILETGVITDVYNQFCLIKNPTHSLFGEGYKDVWVNSNLVWYIDNPRNKT